jgi:hypothetical protein
MLEPHDLIGPSIQHLNSLVLSGNGNTGVPSVIIGKGKLDDDDDTSLESLRKSLKKSEMDTLSAFINRHGDSLVMVARIAASGNEMSFRCGQEAEIIPRVDNLRKKMQNDSLFTRCLVE